MQIEQTLTSCKAILNYAFDSQLLQIFSVIFLILLPFGKLLLSFFKTNNAIKTLEQNSVTILPKKLLKILVVNKIDTQLFIISLDSKDIAVSVGIVSKKIILSLELVKKLSFKELEAVILHEYYHTKFHHSLFLLVSELITKTVFFIPVLQDFKTFLFLAMEKSADQYAVSCQKSNKYLKQAIKKVLMTDDYFELMPRFSYQEMDFRIDSLNLNKSKFALNYSRLLISFMSILIIFILTSGRQSAMASAMEMKLSCTFYNCIQECITTEFNNQSEMSKAYFSINPDY
jgi:beta-lactamase regulating signal transducer with metallopeptidase domain